MAGRSIGKYGTSSHLWTVNVQDSKRSLSSRGIVDLSKSIGEILVNTPDETREIIYTFTPPNAQEKERVLRVISEIIKAIGGGASSPS